MNRSQTEKTLGGPVIFGRAWRTASSGHAWGTRDPHLWCSICSRAFGNGMHREVDGRGMCPYAGCAGGAPVDAYGWSTILRQHPEYPAAPWMAVLYPFDTSGVQREPWRSN